MEAKEWNSNESLKSDLLFEAIFIRGELYCLSKQLYFVIVLSLHMYNITVSQSKTLTIWHKF